MSSPSKARSAKRAWMHAERARFDKEAAAQKASYAAAVQLEKARLTRVLPPDDREDGKFFYPQGRPDHLYLQVASRSRFEPAEIFDARMAAETFRYMRSEIFSLRAKQYALTLPDGTVVVWFGWELG